MLTVYNKHLLLCFSLAEICRAALLIRTPRVWSRLSVDMSLEERKKLGDYLFCCCVVKDKNFSYHKVEKFLFNN